MNFLDFRTELGDHGFSDESTTRLNAVINDAYWDVCSREAWPFLEKQTTINTVASTSALTMPSDFRAALTLTYEAGSYPLRPMRQDDLAKRYVGNMSQTGAPLYYYFIGETINVYPVPDTTYALTLTYLSTPTALVNDTDTPIIPTQHHRVITLGALIALYRMEDDPELAAIFEQQFEKRINTMRNDLWMRQFDRPDQVFDTETWDEYYQF